MSERPWNLQQFDIKRSKATLNNQNINEKSSERTLNLQKVVEKCSERTLKMSRIEFLERKKLLSDVVGKAHINLMFREGYIKGKSIIKKCGVPIDMNDQMEIMKFKKEFLEKASACLKEENLVNHAMLTNKVAIITGGIEVEFCNKPSCHFMRGILSKIYEIYHGERVICKEVGCECVNNKNCIFHIELSI